MLALLLGKKGGGLLKGGIGTIVIGNNNLNQGYDALLLLFSLGLGFLGLLWFRV
jgi:hypothetical protein